MLKLIVLYPQPVDVEKFEADYANHLALLHQKTGIPTEVAADANRISTGEAITVLIASEE